MEIRQPPSAPFLLAAIALGISLWIFPILLAADKSPDGLVLFRPGGDPDYLPPTAAAASMKLGEISVKEYAGTGVRSFPYAAVALHALCYRVAGSAGFILADLLMVVLYGLALRQFLVISGIAPRPAEWLSLLTISTVPQWIAGKASAAMHASMPAIRFWEFRYPRPSVSEIFVVLFLLLATMLAARPHRSFSTFLLLGLVFAAEVQSDLYQAFNATIILAVLSIVGLIISNQRIALAKRLAAMSATIALCSLPFLYQQLHTSLDVKRRWGVFPTNRYAALFPEPHVIVAAILVLAAAAVLAHRYRLSKPERLPAIGVAALAVAASLVSGPLTVLALHQSIQIIHFTSSAALLIGYAVLLYAGWLISDALQLAPIRQISGNRLVAIAATALFVILLFLSAARVSLQRSRSDTPTAASMWDLDLTHYRTDFAALHRVLQRPESAQWLVMGTLDVQLTDWWQYKGRYLYVPDSFNTTLSDSILESRFFDFLHRLGTTPEEFDRLVDDPYIVARVIGLNKYQANALFAPWPMSDYSPEALHRIQTRPGYSTMGELPLSEKERMTKAYCSIDRNQTANALDVIILDKDRLRPYFHPEKEVNLRLLWSNRTFEVWVPANASSY